MFLLIDLTIQKYVVSYNIQYIIKYYLMDSVNI